MLKVKLIKMGGICETKKRIRGLTVWLFQWWKTGIKNVCETFVERMRDVCGMFLGLIKIVTGKNPGFL